MNKNEDPDQGSRITVGGGGGGLALHGFLTSLAVGDWLGRCGLYGTVLDGPYRL
jgi:hypothetical protein